MFLHASLTQKGCVCRERVREGGVRHVFEIRTNTRNSDSLRFCFQVPVTDILMDNLRFFLLFIVREELAHYVPRSPCLSWHHPVSIHLSLCCRSFGASLFFCGFLFVLETSRARLSTSLSTTVVPTIVRDSWGGVAIHVKRTAMAFQIGCISLYLLEMKRQRFLNFKFLGLPLVRITVSFMISMELHTSEMVDKAIV